MPSKESGAWVESVFFGQVTASLSHEINNVLATLRESAGLLSDYANLAERGGRPLEPAKMAAIADRLAVQVKRGVGLVQRLNRFAHTADEPVAEVDPGQLLALAADLFERIATSRGVGVVLLPAAEPLTATTSPFDLLNLIWRLLNRAVGMTDVDKRLELKPARRDDRILIRVTGLDSGAEEGSFPGLEDKVLLERLQGSVSFDSETGEMVLDLPADPG